MGEFSWIGLALEAKKRQSSQIVGFRRGPDFMPVGGDTGRDSHPKIAKQSSN
jgi:hypothetical protein